MLHGKFGMLYVKLCMVYKLKFTKQLCIQAFVLHKNGYKKTMICKKSIILNKNKIVFVQCINQKVMYKLFYKCMYL